MLTVPNRSHEWTSFYVVLALFASWRTMPACMHWERVSCSRGQNAWIEVLQPTQSLSLHHPIVINNKHHVYQRRRMIQPIACFQSRLIKNILLPLAPVKCMRLCNPTLKVVEVPHFHSWQKNNRERCANWLGRDQISGTEAGWDMIIHVVLDSENFPLLSEVLYKKKNMKATNKPNVILTSTVS